MTLARRSAAWRTLAGLLGLERARPERLRARLERLDLPEAERVRLLQLLDLD